MWDWLYKAGVPVAVGYMLVIYRNKFHIKNYNVICSYKSKQAFPPRKYTTSVAKMISTSNVLKYLYNRHQPRLKLQYTPALTIWIQILSQRISMLTHCNKRKQEWGLHNSKGQTTYFPDMLYNFMVLVLTSWQTLLQGYRHWGARGLLISSIHQKNIAVTEWEVNNKI